MDFKSKLLDKKRELEQVIARKKDDLMIPLTESTDELSMYDQHPADIASELYEREKDAGLLEMMELELQKLNDALYRYENGQYGICSICGSQIEPKRLERVLNTTLCIQCARKTRDDFNRPAEEDITFTGAMSDRGETLEIAGYDFYDSDN
ncbi:dnak suppressor protein [hydrocarbon metagenome]|uniref:Dnak suppressor protein n=1 Tax=hydrocarbon metagenome TaxID=938273 RepID=A0A0W8E1D5_9ZZZZ